MSDESRKPIREHLTEKVAALGALHALSHLNAHPSTAHPGSSIQADYKLVMGQFELEALDALAAAAAELRKPTVNDLVDRLWTAGPQTFKQVQAMVKEARAPSGHIETLLNRFRNAGLLVNSSAPSDAADQGSVTMPPHKVAKEDGNVTRTISIDEVPVGEGTPPAEEAAQEDVTSSYTSLVQGEGREWFNARAKAKGIDLNERINCQF